MPPKPKQPASEIEQEQTEQVAKKPVNHNIICEEWKVEYVKGEMQKLKLIRTNVKLSEFALEQVNALTNPHNPIHYFPAGE